MGDAAADGLKVLRRQGEIADGIAGQRIEPQADHHRGGIERAHRLQGGFQGGGIGGPIGSAGQGQVEVGSQARSLSPFFGAPGDVRISLLRPAVQGGIEHVVPPPEDFLGAIAMMKVHVQHGHLPCPRERLGSQGGMVDEAISRVTGASGVVAGGAGEGVGQWLAPGQRPGARQRRGGGAQRGVEGRSDEGRAAVQGEISHPQPGIGRGFQQGQRGHVKGKEFLIHGQPSANLPQRLQVIQPMDARGVLEHQGRNRGHLEAVSSFDRREDGARSVRNVRIGSEAAIKKAMAGMVALFEIVVEDLQAHHPIKATSSSRGPCTPMARVNSISAVREAPLTSTRLEGGSA